MKSIIYLATSLMLSLNTWSCSGDRSGNAAGAESPEGSSTALHNSTEQKGEQAPTAAVPDLRHSPAASVHDLGAKMTLSGDIEQVWRMGAAELAVSPGQDWRLTAGVETGTFQLVLHPHLDDLVGQQVQLEMLFPNVSGLFIEQGEHFLDSQSGLATIESFSASGLRVVFDVQLGNPRRERVMPSTACSRGT